MCLLKVWKRVSNLLPRALMLWMMLRGVACVGGVGGMGGRSSLVILGEGWGCATRPGMEKSMLTLLSTIEPVLASEWFDVSNKTSEHCLSAAGSSTPTPPPPPLVVLVKKRNLNCGENTDGKTNTSIKAYVWRVKCKSVKWYTQSDNSCGRGIWGEMHKVKTRVKLWWMKIEMRGAWLKQVLQLYFAVENICKDSNAVQMARANIWQF
ncbi:hypothetical protein EDD22DRAFT_852439 [Suillus occidentalis]|nr:hypothetical protein EDD22DRAFT_852439 [Suillus occidentalis]